jgi:hypothetical protein
MYFRLTKTAQTEGIRASYQGSVLARHQFIREYRQMISRAKGRLALIDKLLRRKSQRD